MSSTLWLLLYIAPLLAATAVVFAWLGWLWRGEDLRQQVQTEIPTPSTTTTAVADNRSFTASAEKVPTHDHLEDEIHRLRESLAAARAENVLRTDEAAKAHESSSALEAEITRLLHDLEILRDERDQANAELERQRAASPAVLEIIPAPPVPDKAKKSRAATTKASKSAAVPAAHPVEDDLTRIKGIKKTTSDKLRAHGIRTWRQIALWTNADVKAIDAQLALKNRATREKWREQARELHEAVHGPLS